MQTITLVDVLPRVFADDSIPSSEVWRGDLSLRKGDVCRAEAASGGGKSSMCSFLFGAREDYLGRILFDGRDIRTLSMDEWLATRRTSLAYLPQELSLFSGLTAMENIRLKNDLTRHVPESRTGERMERLGIADRRDWPAGRMSVGQQQRVAIIRSLCQPFDFILLDEPVSHLDPANNDVAAALVAEEAARQGAGVISTSVGNHLHLNYNRRLRL